MQAKKVFPGNSELVFKQDSDICKQRDARMEYYFY